MALRDSESCKENHRRFVARVVESELVWGLRNANGWAFCDSNENANDPRTVQLFWSDQPFAKRARDLGFMDYDPTSISLYDFLFRWLTGIEKSGNLAGVNWTADLVGLEYSAAELKNEIMAAMKPEVLQTYRDRLAVELKKDTFSAPKSSQLPPDDSPY